MRPHFTAFFGDAHLDTILYSAECCSGNFLYYVNVVSGDTLPARMGNCCGDPG
jgi:hypothetical protein